MSMGMRGSNSMMGGNGNAFGGAPAGGNSGGSGDAKQTILGIMKELGKTNKFIHKNDIYAVVQQQMDVG
jgi:hypothetical protein